MSKLVSLKEWLEIRFENPPSIRTARRWCETGAIPDAKKFGKLWFVDPKKELHSTGNKSVDELVNRVLQAS